MSKVKGIDISKLTFDVSWKDKDKVVSMVFSNDAKGFKQFSKVLKREDHCVMEASGPYYLRLALYLYQQGVLVSVVNPLSVKRFCQMQMVRTKTDKKDATMIARYGELIQPEAWVPQADYIMEMRDILTTLEAYEKQATQLRNQLEAERHLPVLSKKAKQSRERTLQYLAKQIEILTDELNELAIQHYGESLKKLQTIPGIGMKTSVMLIIVSNNFENFDDARQLSAYIGISPRVFQSGTSIKGKGRICKMGNPRARKLLYLCSWTAQNANTQCKALKERLEQRGKPSRVIKIAIANKLLRMAFAVVKKGTAYDKNIGLKTCF